ncbi:MAG: hypothetical protein J7483_11065, partial [Novosphingobium sp.]|nr:hypothetical protein [Novosphingobium sp.]
MARTETIRIESSDVIARPGSDRSLRTTMRLGMSVAGGAFAIMLSGCAVGPDPRPPSAASLHLPGD